MTSSKSVIQRRANRKWGIDLGVPFVDSKELRELRRLIKA